MICRPDACAATATPYLSHRVPPFVDAQRVATFAERPDASSCPPPLQVRARAGGEGR